jgi:4-hydroxy-3-methylbut-2-enyl diphosphate reductase
MKILLAKSSGFCMGVRRAVELVLDTSVEQEGPIHTYGPLIHNPQVLKVLEEKGIQVLSDVPERGKGTVLIRAHGVPPEIKEDLGKAGFNILDATCPRVIKIQAIIEKFASKNYTIIIIGDENHPEVIGLFGYSNGKGYVVSSLEQLKALPHFEKAIVVAQTTQNLQSFEEIKIWLQNNLRHYKLFETICDSTEKRQAEIKRLSQTVDAVLVVGGRNSGNTRRLAEIAKESGKPVFHIESEDDFNEGDLDELASASYIGITAGASTPNWIIKKVYRALEQLPYRQKRGWRRRIYSIQRLLLLTNIYVSLGAGCLSYAGTRLLGIGDYWPYIAMSVLYVQSMHLLNHLTGTKADRYNDPDRAAFYEKNKAILTLTAVIAGSVGLLIAMMLGTGPFVVLLAMSITGMSYNLRILPKLSTHFKYRRIKDIPGSKTILISVAWGVLAAILPPLAVDGQITLLNLLLFICFAGLVFVRTSFFDILDMQGDRLIGKDTIAIILGEKQMMNVLNVILVALIFILPLVSIFQMVSPLGFALTICPIFMLMIFGMYRKGYLLPGIRLELLVETLFVLAGFITVLWPMSS